MIPLSPGIVQGSIGLFDLLRKHELNESTLMHSFPKIGAIESPRILDCAHALGWLTTDDTGRLQPIEDVAFITDGGDYADIVRLVILDFAKKVRPSWLQNTLSGRLKVVHFAGAGISQLLAEADLVESTTQQTVDFWDTLACIARGLQNARLNDIGRVGERLTLDYEQTRTGHTPKWISLDSNEDGYDVLSRASSEDNSYLKIEVKTTSVGFRGHMYITANEWEVATNSSNHVFDIWDISQKPPKLCRVGPSQILANIPENKGAGSWQSVQIELQQFQEFAQPIFVGRVDFLS